MGVSPATLRPQGRGFQWAAPLLPVALSVFFVSALVYYHIQVRLSGSLVDGLFQATVVGLYDLIGFVPAFMLALLVLVWSSIWFITGKLERPWVRVARLLGFTLALSLMVNLQQEGVAASEHGGAIGAFLAARLQSVFGYGFSTLVAALIALATMLLATDFFFFRYFESLHRRGEAKRKAVLEPGVENNAVDELRRLSLAATAAAPVVGEPGLSEADAMGWAGTETEAAEPALEVVPPEFVAPDIVAPEIEVSEVDAPEIEALHAPEEEFVSRRRRRRMQLLEDDQDEAEVASESVPGQEPTTATAEAGAGVEPESELDVALEYVEARAEELGAEEAAEESDEDDEEEESDEDDEEEEFDEDEEEEESDEDEEEEESDEDEEEEESDEDEEEEEADEDEEEEEADEDEEEEEADEEEEEEEPDEEDEGEDPDEEDEEEEPDEEEFDEEEEATDEVEGIRVELDEPEADASVEEESLGGESDDPRQGDLFFKTSQDADVVEEATALVCGARRATATFLQRRLRVGYGEALELLDVLRERGVVDGEPGTPSGRVLPDVEEPPQAEAGAEAG